MPGDMEDIELARSLLEEEQWNLVIVKGGRTLLNSKERGVAPLFQAIQNMGESLHNAAAADRIVGSAVAMLCLHTGITTVYACIASQAALDMLKQQGVTITSKSIVPYISNYDGTDLCPFEKMAKDAGEPSRLLATLQSLFAEGDE
jgi:hypothetical protein